MVDQGLGVESEYQSEKEEEFTDEKADEICDDFILALLVHHASKNDVMGML